MLTMHPSIMLGSYVLSQDRLPTDEFVLRREDIHAKMDAHGWKALLVYGDAREHAALAYLSNFIPRMRWGMALLPREGAPRLLCAMSSRDIPAMKTMTWIEDVHSGWEWKTFDDWVARYDGETNLKFASVGFDLMAPPLDQAVRRSLGNRFHLDRADDLLRLPTMRKRPRELSMIRAASAALNDAAQTLLASWRETKSPETAALAAERHARQRAAQDVRILVSLDNGRTLMPMPLAFEKVDQPLLAYLAIKQAGYWADTFVSDGRGADAARRRANAALDAICALARPDTTAADLHAAAVKALNGPLHPVLGDSVGRSIGLSLHEGAEFRAGETATRLAQDGVYALQAGLADPDAGNAIVSAVVRVTGNGHEVLSRSPAAAAS